MGYAVAPPASLLAANDKLEFEVMDAEAFSIQLAGTWVGTVTFRATVNGVDYIPIGLTPAAGGAVATTATAVGIWGMTANPGYTKVQAFWTTRTSGTVLASAITRE